MSRTTLIDALPDVVLVVRRDGRILDSLGGRVFSLELAPDQMIGRQVDEVLPETVARTLSGSTGRVLKTRKPIERAAEDGDQRYEVRLSAHGRERVLAVIRDVSPDASASSGRLLQPDTLVNEFAGREQFVRALDSAVAEARMSERTLAVVCVGFTDFETLTGDLDTNAVDGLLQQLGERCCAVFEDSEVVPRLPGHARTWSASRIERAQFVMIVPRAGDVEQVENFATDLGELLAQPLPFGDSAMTLQPRIAMALAPQDGNTGEHVLGCALAALAEAGALDTTGVERYTDARRVHSERQQDLAEELRWAIEEDQLCLHYQPVFELAEANPVAMEAFLRWRHPLRGLLTPAQFLPLAEATGQIQRISEWVLRKACQDHVELVEKTGTALAVSVNFSRHYFSRPDLIEHLQSVFDETGFNPCELQLDITERMLMRMEVVGPLLARLKALGIAIQVDNFGSGYSSLKQIRRLPLDALKIDGDFIAGIGRSDDDEALCRSIISLAHAYGLRCVAEAVETRDQVRFLRRAGCDDIQGNLFGAEMPISAMEIFVEQFRHGRSFGSQTGDAAVTEMAAPSF